MGKWLSLGPDQQTAGGPAAAAWAGAGGVDASPPLRVTKRMAGIRAAQDARRDPEAVVFWMVVWHHGRLTQGDPAPDE